MVDALATGNVVVPAGNLYIKDQMPLVPTTPWSPTSRSWASIPIRLGKNVYIRDVATIQDATDINYGCALVNGQKSVYIPVVKKDTASTLTVVADIHESMPLFRDVVPEDVDGPLRVRRVADGAWRPSRAWPREGLIGAALTGLMILIFLRDLRSVIVVVLNIPLALTAARWSACG